MTLRDKALKNIITEEMKEVANFENVSENFILEGMKRGIIAIPNNSKRKKKFIYGIGEGLSVKVNANIGSSPYHIDIDEEILKLKTAIDAGAHSVMDLSLGSKIKIIRKRVLEESDVMVGTVPIYETGFNLSNEKKDIVDMTIDDYLKTVEEQAKSGVDFMTIHSGVNIATMNRMFNEKRIMNVVSRGGSFLIAWMKHNCKESPLFEHFDKILDILHEYDVTISLGDGMRPGACADASDRAQIEELIVLGELTQMALDKGVQVMVEGPGHVPLNQIEMNVKLMKRICHNVPFYVLGPLVNDISAGYDHIAGAIGGAIAAYNGADFLCYVTPSEHLRLPTPADVKEGVVASLIAAFSADLARERPYALRKNRKMTDARRNLEWDKQIINSIDPLKAARYRSESEIGENKECTMCGDFCAVKRLNELAK
ncbi:MAG: phosphomethylpyrimidine synthase ThiC [bacterium]